MLRSARVVARQTMLRLHRRSLATEASDSDITIQLPTDSFEGYELDAPSLEVPMSKSALLDMYREMSVIRRMEMAADALYKAKEVRGFCHLSIGQEAIAVGIEHAITPKDSVITAYRCHGFTYTRGATVEAIIAELLGKATGVSHGKGGSMHMFTPNFYGGNGIVGAQVPVGLGLAFAHQYRKDNAVTFALYGDGAANQGQVFEAYNMAKLWKVPAIFACENNKYGMGTAASRSSALTEYYKRGQYIPGLKINGMDAVACYAGSKFAREWALAGNGPLVLEYETYRYGGHSMSDPGTTYRTREEIQNMRSHHDSITGLKTRIIDLGIASEQELKAIDKESRASVDADVKKAKDAPFPSSDPENMYLDVYYRGTEVPYFRGRIPEENFSYNN